MNDGIWCVFVCSIRLYCGDEQIDKHAVLCESLELKVSSNAFR